MVPNNLCCFLLKAAPQKQTKTEARCWFVAKWRSWKLRKYPVKINDVFLLWQRFVSSCKQRLCMIHTPQCNIFVTHMQELNADICCSITRSAAKKKSFLCKQISNTYLVVRMTLMELRNNHKVGSFSWNQLCKIKYIFNKSHILFRCFCC